MLWWPAQNASLVTGLASSHVALTSIQAKNEYRPRLVSFRLVSFRFVSKRSGQVVYARRVGQDGSLKILMLVPHVSQHNYFALRKCPS